MHNSPVSIQISDLSLLLRSIAVQSQMYLNTSFALQYRFKVYTYIEYLLMVAYIFLYSIWTGLHCALCVKEPSHFRETLLQATMLQLCCSNKSGHKTLRIIIGRDIDATPLPKSLQ